MGIHRVAHVPRKPYQVCDPLPFGAVVDRDGTQQLIELILDLDDEGEGMAFGFGQAANLAACLLACHLGMA